MKRVTLALCAIIFSLIGIVSCSKGGGSDDNPNNNNACDGIPKTFATNVNPLIQTFCNQPNCHNSTSSNGPGPLTNYVEVFSARDRIKAQVATGLMPQNTVLTTAQKNTIICWIESGAPNN